MERLHNWISRLQVVLELKIEDQNETLRIPKQIVICNKETLFNRQAWQTLMFLAFRKPLVADGSAKPHKTVLIFNRKALNKLNPPIVLQVFVDHRRRAVAVAEHVKCVKRKSLVDVLEEKLSGVSEDLLLFLRVSNLVNP